MATFPVDSAVNLVINNVKMLIQYNKLEEALDILDEFRHISNDLELMILLNKARLTELQDQITSGIILDGAISVEQNKIKQNLYKIATVNIPNELHVQQILRGRTPLYQTTDDKHLEAVLGPVDYLVKINWLHKAIKASRSVCQVVRNDSKKGTGFVLQNGYLMTNAHVLPNADRASTAKIIFDFEEDEFGKERVTTEFTLDASDAKFSSVTEYDYAYVKIKDNNPQYPISQWGFLEPDRFSIPQENEPVTIIQHPLGQTKQIALTANQVIRVDGPKVFYKADTQKGSSGSPVFNNDWKVVALHHAGKSDEDGGLIINQATGERKGANEGILMKDIMQHITGM